jgi:membrane protease YdiL (CAAX protease family)
LAAFTRFATGLAVVVVSMLALFTVQRDYFVVMTIVSTSCMVGVAFELGGLHIPARLRYASIVVGLASAAFLYLVFLLGGTAVDSLHPLGITSASEASIYSLIASPSNPFYVQVGLLLFDSAGYESFFRGVLQDRLQKRMGIAAVPAVALLDAGLHLATLNPIWVGATFVTDLVWGLTYYYGKGMQASFTSHFVWDLAIFVVRPIV